MPPAQARDANGQPDFIVTSTDAGASWRTTAAPLEATLYRAPSGVTIAYNAAQLTYGRTLIYHSLDQGLTWTRVANIDAGGQITSIAADARGRMIAVTEYGHVLLSDDDGASWRKQWQASIDARLALPRPMFFFEHGVVVAVVAVVGRRTVLRSTDRGHSGSESIKAAISLRAALQSASV